MLIVHSPTVAQSWMDTCRTLFDTGIEDEHEGFFRHDTALIEIDDVTTDFQDSRFPMKWEDIETINEFLVTGAQEERVVHEWTKIYRHRLFDGEINQIQQLIEYLRVEPAGKRAQATVWQPTDISAPIAPCLQVLWFQIRNEQLEMHVHMRAVDCYGKLLMNVNEFAAVQRYVARELQVAPGLYTHFIDSLHFNTADKDAVISLLAKK